MKGIDYLLDDERPWARLLGRLPDALLIFLFVFSLFGLTTSNVMFGYEAGIFRNAQSWLRLEVGEINAAGFIEIVMHLPAALVHELIPPHRLQSIRNLAPGLTQPLVTSLMCTVFFLLARTIYRKTWVAVILTIVLASATMVWPYSKFGMENCQTLGTLLLVLGFFRYHDKPGWGSAVGIGLASMFLILTKVTAPMHLVVFGFCFIAFLTMERKLPPGRTILHGATAAGFTLLGHVIVVTTNAWRYGMGTSLVTGRYNLDKEISATFIWNTIPGALFSPGKSIFVFSPILVVAALLIPAFCSRSRRNGMLIILPAALLLLGYGVSSFDETWGPRRLHWITPLLLLPAGIAIERWRLMEMWKRGAIIVLMVVSIGYQIIGLSFNYTNHNWTLGPSPQYAQMQIVWNPQMNAARFHVHQMRSAISRMKGEGPIPYVIEDYWVPWHEPDPKPDPLVFPLADHDKWDFWWAQHAVMFGGPGQFFRQASSLFLWFCLFGLLFSCAMLEKRMRKRSQAEA